MLKSKVESLKERKELPFPKLMVSIKGKVIIATSQQGDDIKGYVLYAEDDETMTGFASCWAAHSFKNFYGSITLTQTPE